MILMCLILFAYHVHPDIPLIVAANRDEFYGRATEVAHFWQDKPAILAGRDLEKMGTWMGVTKDGRFAGLTNYRDPLEETAGKSSRGELVSQYLTFNGKTKDFQVKLENSRDFYPGYNILFGDVNELYYYSNVNRQSKVLGPGIYGLSNHFLNTEWPKVKMGKEGLSRIIAQSKEEPVEDLFQLLQHSEHAPDHMLPHTGVSLEWERVLSPLFIQSEQYGTRSSTVLLMKNEKIEFFERVYTNPKMEEKHFIIKQG